MTEYKQLCAELVDDLELCDWPYKLKETIRSDIDRARDALAEPEPEGPTDEPIIPDHYHGDNIRVYREGFHAGYKYAFQLIEKHSDV